MVFCVQMAAPKPFRNHVISLESKVALNPTLIPYMYQSRAFWVHSMHGINNLLSLAALCFSSTHASTHAFSYYLVNAQVI